MTENADKIFLDIVSSNRKGLAKGIYSICSANREVLEACFMQAKDDNSIILIESTSNQVNQFGGYTGMKPEDFVKYVNSIRTQTGFPEEKLLLGGDHLGPNAWQTLPAKEAMSKAMDLIADYVKAGYRKIHLDTSMFCSDDAGDRSEPLSRDIVALRTAGLCKVAEETCRKYFNHDHDLFYIIGTEVPVPGGAKLKEETVNATDPEDVNATIDVFHKHFMAAGMSEAWDRVKALVVQPGVEFGDDQVFGYKRTSADLSNQIINFPNLVYEAHSTDYQSEDSLKALVEDHFCILKVGPWLTFAYREALFALESMEMEMLGKNHPDLSNISATLERIMIENPKYWEPYYRGDENEKSFKRKFSFSDRSRYYWPNSEVEDAKKKLYTNLIRNKIPLSLLSQFMPEEFYQVCAGFIPVYPQHLVYSHIRRVAAIYSRACAMTSNEERQGKNLSLLF
jgi:D-tagatose-1,6-bisphosphate aldolase subunit GatZ/KbaZ